MLALAQAYLQGVRVDSTEICHHPFEPAVDLSRRMSRFHEPDQYLSILTHSQTGDRRRAGSPKFGHVRLFVCFFRRGSKLPHRIGTVGMVTGQTLLQVLPHGRSRGFSAYCPHQTAQSPKKHAALAAVAPPGEYLPRHFEST